MAMAPAPIASRALLLLLLLLLVATWAAALSENRDIDQYEHSGYFWPKTLLWRGIRSSPGVLWFSFFIFAEAAFVSLLMTAVGNADLTEILDAINSANQEAAGSSSPGRAFTLADLHDYVDAFVQYGLGATLLYVSLAVTRLSDALEAYLVGLCSIQLLLDSRRTRKAGSLVRDYIAIVSFVASAVFGIAMLDSFHALNVLNVVYSTPGLVLIMLAYGLGVLEPGSPTKKKWGIILSVAHFLFPVAAFLVARGVEGSHRQPMLAYLVTAGVSSFMTTCIHLCIASSQ